MAPTTKWENKQQETTDSTGRINISPAIHPKLWVPVQPSYKSTMSLTAMTLKAVHFGHEAAMPAVEIFSIWNFPVNVFLHVGYLRTIYEHSCCEECTHYKGDHCACSRKANWMLVKCIVSPSLVLFSLSCHTHTHTHTKLYFSDFFLLFFQIQQTKELLLLLSWSCHLVF